MGVGCFTASCILLPCFLSFLYSGSVNLVSAPQEKLHDTPVFIVRLERAQQEKSAVGVEIKGVIGICGFCNISTVIAESFHTGTVTWLQHVFLSDFLN